MGSMRRQMCYTKLLEFGWSQFRQAYIVYANVAKTTHEQPSRMEEKMARLVLFCSRGNMLGSFLMLSTIT